MSRVNAVALLRDVSAAIIASGYAALPKRPYVRSGAQIAELARDDRLGCTPHSSGNVALIEDVMYRYKVGRNNARRMMWAARKMHKSYTRGRHE